MTQPEVHYWYYRRNCWVQTLLLFRLFPLGISHSLILYPRQPRIGAPPCKRTPGSCYSSPFTPPWRPRHHRINHGTGQPQSRALLRVPQLGIQGHGFCTTEFSTTSRHEAHFILAMAIRPVDTRAVDQPDQNLSSGYKPPRNHLQLYLGQACFLRHLLHIYQH